MLKHKRSKVDEIGYEDESHLLLRLDPLLTDVDQKESVVECGLCHNADINAGDNNAKLLWWYEYHPSIHSPGKSRKICDHCLFPPPKNIDFVMCGQMKHLFCLYCIELKLFRVQLGRFVMEHDDDDDLGLQWERDYVDYRKKGGVSGLSQSVLSPSNLCGCFGKKDDFFADNDTGRERTDTHRFSGYDQSTKAGFHENMIEMSLQDNKSNKKKKRKKSKEEQDPDASSADLGAVNVNDIVDEAEIDEMYQDEFEVNNEDNVVIGNNKKKQKAVELLLEACEKGKRQPPSVIIELNYDKYSVYCFSYVMGKLELKQRPFLFHALEFISMVSPTTVVIQLVIHYKKQILMLPYKRIDKLFLAVIRGSKYSIATALKMASLAQEFADVDLSAKDVFLKLKEKYEAIAIELIKQIESHHLAAILLETPTDIEGMTPLDIAFEYQLFNFLSQSKIEKIAHQVWIERFFLNPKRTFEVSDIDSWNILEYLKNPYTFYFQPHGKQLLQFFLFFSYLMMFSYILLERPAIYDTPQPIEIIFWVFNIGYFAFEVHEAFIEDGIAEYLTSWTNYIDMSISINFATQIVLRCYWIFGTAEKCDPHKIEDGVPLYNYNTGLELHDWQRCPTEPQIQSSFGYWTQCDAPFRKWPNTDDTLCTYNATNAYYYNSTEICDCWKQLDNYLSDSCCRNADSDIAVLFNFLYGLNAILLWMRSLYFAEQSSVLGPLIKIIMAMRYDFVNYLKLTMLLMVGFSFAIRAFIGDFSYEFSAVTSTILYMFKSTFGKIDFTVLEACGDAPDDLCSDKGWISFWRSNLVQLLIMIYLVIALIMIRLLIAMISFTYNRMIKQAEHQVVYQKIKNAYELDRSSGLMPPPLNIVVFAIFVIWLIMDILMVILINRYIDIENHLQLAKPVGSSYIKRVWHGIQDLFSRNTHYWICQYCKHHNLDKYDINNYLKQFRPACDPADAKIVEVYAPTICESCYRNKSEVGRMTIVLQQISFLVFVVCVYPFLVIIVFIPALLSWIADYISERSDSAEDSNWGDADDGDDKKKQFKRHQTMGVSVMNKKGGGAGAAGGGGVATRARTLSKQSTEYKLKKKRKLEERRKKERRKLAEKYRILRQMQQLDSQLAAVPVSESQTSAMALKKSLHHIIKTYNPKNKKNILTPNINEIVDDVTSDKTPIAKLQHQVNDIHSKLDELYELVKASNTYTMATSVFEKATSNGSSGDDDDDDDYDDTTKPKSQLSQARKKKKGGAHTVQISIQDENDQTMEFAAKAAMQLHEALKLSNRKSLKLRNRMSSKRFVGGGHAQQKSQRMSAMHLAEQLLSGSSGNFSDDNVEVELTGKDTFVLKPTDTMRHKSSYKNKSTRNILLADDDENIEIRVDSPAKKNEPVISSTIDDRAYDFANDDDVDIVIEEEKHETNNRQKKPKTKTNTKNKTKTKNKNKNKNKKNKKNKKDKKDKKTDPELEDQLSDTTDAYLENILDEAIHDREHD